MSRSRPTGLTSSLQTLAAAVATSSNSHDGRGVAFYAGSAETGFAYCGRSRLAGCGRDCEFTASPLSCPSMLEPRRPRAASRDLGALTLAAMNRRWLLAPDSRRSSSPKLIEFHPAPLRTALPRPHLRLSANLAGMNLRSCLVDGRCRSSSRKPFTHH